MGWFISCLMVRFFKASRVSFPAPKQTWLTTARVLFMAMKILDKNFFFSTGTNLSPGVTSNKTVLVSSHKRLSNSSYAPSIVPKTLLRSACVLMAEVKNGCLRELKILSLHNKHISFHGTHMLRWRILYYWYSYIILHRAARTYSIGMTGHFFCNLTLNGVIYGANRQAYAFEGDRGSCLW